MQYSFSFTIIISSDLEKQLGHAFYGAFEIKFEKPLLGNHNSRGGSCRKARCGMSGGCKANLIMALGMWWWGSFGYKVWEGNREGQEAPIAIDHVHTTHSTHMYTYVPPRST